MFFLRFLDKYRWVFFISILLFVIPFFWLAPGEMDLGGDANRLYFYDPISFLKSTGLYPVAAEGRGSIDPKHYYLPYVSLIAVLKFIFSSTIVIGIFNGLKLAGGFLGVYLVAREILIQSSLQAKKKYIEVAAVVSGIFYIVSQTSIHMSFFWDRALFTHDQIFLNPIVFYLLLKFFLTQRYTYLWNILLLSFIFATNFGLAAAPALAAFYPLSIVFLCLFIVFVCKRSIPWKKLLVGLLLGLGIHAFHLLPSAASFLDKGSVANAVVFNKHEIEQGGVAYFSAVSGQGKAVLNLLLPPEKFSLRWFSLIAPLLIILSFIFGKEKAKKGILLTVTFFLLIFFLATANITTLGFEFYKKLFYIPGFSMFRVFFEKWMYVFTFFYSLELGFGILGVLSRLKGVYARMLILITFVLFICMGLPLFTGNPVNQSVIRGSNTKTSFIMDPEYEQVFRYIQSLKKDGKILVLPVTDYFRQIIAGQKGGAYEGPSTFLHLTDIYSFVGYQHFGYKNNMPYAEDILRYAREKQYDRLLAIFSVLNIRYIFHNTDPMVYEKGFFPGPYGYVQTSLPKTQDEYKTFLKNFPLQEIYRQGKYVISKLDDEYFNPTIFTPIDMYISDTLSFDKTDNHSVFINPDTCKKEHLSFLCAENYQAQAANTSFEMVNPALYKVTIKPEKKMGSLLLVMQHSFHEGWKLSYDERFIAENEHFVANGYANAWLINESDVSFDKEITLYVTFDPQKYFGYGVWISIFSLSILAFLVLYSFAKKHNEKN